MGAIKPNSNINADIMRLHGFFHDVRFLLSSFLLLVGCTSTQHDAVEQTLFTRLNPDQTGISFTNTNSEDARYNIIQYEYFYNGGGVAVGDINNDGLVDIFFTSNQGRNALYLNKGNLEFEDISKKSGIESEAGWKTGVAMADINSDGFIDIYVCRSGPDGPSARHNMLFINNGDLTFTDQAKSYGVDDDSYTTHAAFLDYDRDGDLDLFLLNHSRLTISNSFDVNRRNASQREPYVGNRLLRNDKGKFIDVSDAAGVFGPATNYGLGICYGDLNGDGWIDLYTSNDYSAKDKVLYNNKHGGFIEVSDSVLTHMSQFSMGIDIADINNDGLLDILSLDMLPESNARQKELLWPNRYDVYQAMVKNGLHHQYMRNMLQVNNGDGTFSEVGQLAGISNTDWSWSSLIADFDNDGLQDIFVSNGFKREFINNDFLKYKADLRLKASRGQKIDLVADLISKMPSNKVHNYVYKNQGDISFMDVSKRWGFDTENLTNGAAYADLDNDGDLDLVINNLDEVSLIYRNNSNEFKGTNFLKIACNGLNGNPNGFGSEVTVYLGKGKMKRTLCPYRGFQSSMEPVLFFGLDSLTIIDSLLITWPTGDEQWLRNIGVNQTLTLNQKEARTTGTSDQVISPKLFSRLDSGINIKHKEDDFVDFRVQSLLPRTYSTSGPAMASGDVNGDGLEDLFLGGAHGQESVIMLQQRNGTYQQAYSNTFKADAGPEDVDALFFDMDNDKDLDLYVVTGGNELQIANPMYNDRLYENNGKGNFTKVSLGDMNNSGSCVRAADIDHDDDLDLFVGSRIIPGRYPEPPESYILLNDGRGVFTRSSFSLTGMITDASWLDINTDGWSDLVVVGEWMPVLVFTNDNGKLLDKSSSYITHNTRGWWNKILVDDFDNDGDLDFVAGNFGMNNQFRATAEHPAVMYYADYDGNGSVDPILNYYIGDKLSPSPTRDELMEQIPSFRKRFNDYASYGKATIKSILTPDEQKKSVILTAHEMRSCYFENKGSSFSVTPLPWQAQTAPIFSFLSVDADQDGHLDIITGGNLTKMGARFGRATANFGGVLLGDGKGSFQAASSSQSGLSIRGDVRGMIRQGDQLVVSVNNDYPQLWRMNQLKK